MGRRSSPKPRQPASLAERWRAHREAFELALQLGCTPKEAEAEIARRKAAQQAREARARLRARMNATPRPAHEHWSAPWMMRD